METIENADLNKAVLNKIMTTQGQCVKYDFVAPFSSLLFCVNAIFFYSLFVVDIKYLQN